MTSDAKIGLILGLAFIVLIAFLLTGLPTFLGKDASGGVSTTLPSAGVSVVLDEQAENAMQAIEDMGIHEDVEERQINIGRDTAGDDRFGSGSNDTSVATGGGVERVNRPAAKKVRRYVVQSGDNLAKIAKKAYGPEEGNRFVTLQKIYEANTNVMESIDDVKTGVKLVIPSLEVAAAPTTVEEAKEAGVFTRVGNLLGIGSSNKRSEPKRVYVVKEGDTLWEIASKQLGDGSRYNEIAKLNKSSVGNADSVAAGIKLMLPVD